MWLPPRGPGECVYAGLGHSHLSSGVLMPLDHGGTYRGWGWTSYVLCPWRNIVEVNVSLLFNVPANMQYSLEVTQSPQLVIG